MATQRKIPASTCLTPVTWRIPFGKRVYLEREGSGETLLHLVTSTLNKCVTVKHIHYLLLVVSSGALFLSQVMLASGMPLISHWKRATPPSSTVMDSGWVWNFGRAEEQTTHSHSWKNLGANCFGVDIFKGTSLLCCFNGKHFLKLCFLSLKLYENTMLTQWNINLEMIKWFYLVPGFQTFKHHCILPLCYTWDASAIQTRYEKRI